MPLGVPELVEPGETLDAPTRRVQAAMVLFAFEQALAALVRDLMRSYAGGRPRALQAAAGRLAEGAATDDCLPATYIGELLDTALEVAKGRSESGPLTSLRRLFDALSIYDVRNAIAHPNNPFPPYYWYRAKALAADPANEQLGFAGVRGALVSALLGQLTPPPDEWLRSILWKLPNNLPSVFEHESTGLVGRRAEREALLKLARNSKFNLIAVVAPGGIGKTALLLDCLREICSTPSDATWVDQLIWVTAKTHTLTWAGERRTAGEVSIHDIATSIASEVAGDPSATLSDVVERYQGRRLVLALDNLEGVLRDSPEEFSELYQTLPGTWRVLITSRVPVDSATTLSLKSLTDEGALQLANSYLRWKGADSRPDLHRLVRSCECNPLAIRLAIDGFSSGANLDDVLVKTRHDIIRYSYRVLADSLKPTDRRLVETLFAVGGTPNREELGSLLEVPIDEVAATLGVLLRTSLVLRVLSEGEERYELSAGIRELVTLEPLDVSFRSEVLARRRKTRVLATEYGRLQAERRVGPLHPHFVPAALPEPERMLAYRVSRCLSARHPDRDEVARLAADLARRGEGQPRSRTAERLLALCDLELGDRAQGMALLRRAGTEEGYDPAAALRLAYELAMDGELDEAIGVSKRLLDDGWGEASRSDPDAAGLVWKNYWVHRIWNGDSASVVTETLDWSSRTGMEFVAGLVHAQACRRAIEHAYEGNFSQVEAGLLRAVETFEALFKRFGVGGPAAREAAKLVEQLAYAARARRYVPGEEALTSYVRFVATWLPEICGVHQDLPLTGSEVRQWTAALWPWFEAAGEPMGWAEPAEAEETGPLAPSERDAHVYYIPKPRYDGTFPVYLFAKTADDSQYYVARDKFVGSIDEWTGLRVGSALVIVPAPHASGSATPVQSARLAVAPATSKR